MLRVSLVVGFSALACAGPRPAVRYDGSEEQSLVKPHEIEVVASLPEGYDVLGDISARCTRDDSLRELDGAWLSDVDCSERRLRQALREKAADAGGELLVGLSCGSRPARGAVDVRCKADVARPGDDLLAERELARRNVPPPVEPGPPASEAWRIRVHFRQNPGIEARRPRRPEDIREVPDFPVSHVRLGDVVTDCEEACSFDAVRHGVLAAAARMGATDVVDVRCAERGQGWICSGTAAAYEVEPELDKRAH